MCGIVGTVAKRDAELFLLESLKKLEYRGYDSAGIAIIDYNDKLHWNRTTNRIDRLLEMHNKEPLVGTTGIAHTRWATHGKPSEHNAHPQISTYIAVVHNGIIENHCELRSKLEALGYNFISDTDTEVAAHLIHYHDQTVHNLLKATQLASKELTGAYALGIISEKEPDRLIAVRCGSPLVVGFGDGENYIASDVLALLQVSRKFIFLEEKDVADVRLDNITIYDCFGKKIERMIYHSDSSHHSVSIGNYSHFMEKEIFEQPYTLKATIDQALSGNTINLNSFGPKAENIFCNVKNVQIIACGTSYHSGLIAKYWLEDIANIHCQVEIASEYRYRKKVILPDTLFVSISQSGETADTLAALKQAKSLSYLSTLTICNVQESSIVRASELAFITHAGTEIGVASTKAFTAQLVALFALTLSLAKDLPKEQMAQFINDFKHIPLAVDNVLLNSEHIKHTAKMLQDKYHTLFLGRGLSFPVAMEGALKLKEISYIHAEAYAAGELKHGPLALVDKNMPVIVIAPYDHIIDKLKSNIEEVRARDGMVIAFADKRSNIKPKHDLVVVEVPEVSAVLSPIVYTIPLQLLAYYVAVLKGTDVDRPRNLAKSVTVE